MISYIDAWRFTFPLQEKYRISKPDVCEDLFAFFVYNGAKRLTVEVNLIGERKFVVWVLCDNSISHVYTNSSHIRKDMLDLVEECFRDNSCK